MHIGPMGETGPETIQATLTLPFFGWPHHSPRSRSPRMSDRNYKEGITPEVGRRNRRRTMVSLRKQKRDDTARTRRMMQSPAGAVSAASVDVNWRHVLAMADVDPEACTQVMRAFVSDVGISELLQLGAPERMVQVVLASGPFGPSAMMAMSAMCTHPESCERIVAAGGGDLAVRAMALQEYSSAALWLLGNMTGISGTATRDHLLDIGLVQAISRLESPEDQYTSMWTLVNISKKNMTLAQESAVAILHMAMTVIRKTTEVIVRTDCAWVIAHIVSGAAVRATIAATPAYMEVVRKEILDPETKVSRPMIRVVANLACGTIPEAEAAMPFYETILKNLVETRSATARVDCMWYITSVACGDHYKVINDVLPLIVKRAIRAGEDERVEAMWAMSNYITSASKHNDSGFMRAVTITIEGFVYGLRVESNDVICAALDGIKAIINHASKLSTLESVKAMIDQCEGYEALDDLKAHQCPEIYEMAVSVLESLDDGSEEDDLDLSNTNETFTFQ